MAARQPAGPPALPPVSVINHAIIARLATLWHDVGSLSWLINCLSPPGTPPAKRKSPELAGEDGKAAPERTAADSRASVAAGWRNSTSTAPRGTAGQATHATTSAAAQRGGSSGYGGSGKLAPRGSYSSAGGNGYSGGGYPMRESYWDSFTDKPQQQQRNGAQPLTYNTQGFAPRTRPLGMTNLGNTCYMNATLQVSPCPPLRPTATQQWHTPSTAACMHSLKVVIRSS